MHTAADWYQVHRFGDDISLIRETHVASWLRCNIWHVRGRERDLVIDTGMGLRPLKPVIVAESGRPLTVISTHAHFDHIGAAHEFDRRLGHALEADIHARPNEANTGGWSAFIRAETFTALPDDGFAIESYAVTPAPLTGYLDEGDVVDLGDRHFNVLHLPGHSPGSIALFEASTGILFSGDVIYDGALFDTVYHSDKAAYRQSLKRLREIDVSTIHAGHFASFDRTRMRKLIDDYLAGKNALGDPASWVEAQTRP